MKITTLNELVTDGRVHGPTWNGVEYLINNPSQFIPLIKEDVVLANQYVKFMQKEHIMKIISADAKLFSKIYEFSYEPNIQHIALDTRPLSFELTKENFHQLMEPHLNKFVYKFEPNNYNNRSSRFSYRGRDAFATSAVSGVYSNGILDPVVRFDKEVCELPFRQENHNKHVNSQILEIMNVMLTSVKGENIFDKEIPASSFTRIFSSESEYSLLENVIKNKDYELFANIITQMSAHILLAKLAKGNLLEEITDNLPSSQQAMAACLTHLATRDKNLDSAPAFAGKLYFQEFLKKLPSIFLLSLQQKSAPLALQFLDLNPELVAECFPSAAEQLKALRNTIEAPVASAPTWEDLPPYNVTDDYSKALARIFELEQANKALLQMLENNTRSNSNNGGSSSAEKEFSLYPKFI